MLQDRVVFSSSRAPLELRRRRDKALRELLPIAPSPYGHDMRAAHFVHEMKTARSVVPLS